MTLNPAIQLRIALALRALLPSGMMVLPGILCRWEEGSVTVGLGLILQICFSIAIVLLETPTGLFADKESRPRAIQVGLFAGMLGELTYAAAGGFFTFLVAELLLALSAALLSGALEAYIYDTVPTVHGPLTREQRAETFTTLWRKSGAIGSLVAVPVLPLAGFVASIDCRIPFLVWAIIMGIAFIFSLFLSEAPREGQPDRITVRVMAKVGYECLRNSSYRWISLASALSSGTLIVAFWLNQKMMDENAYTPTEIAVVLAIGNLTLSYGQYRSRKVIRSESGKGKAAFLAALLILSLTMCGLSFLPAVGGIALIFVQQMIRGFFLTAVPACINELIHEGTRATALSFQSLFQRVGSFVITLATLIPMELGGTSAAYTTVFLISIGGWAMLRRGTG